MELYIQAFTHTSYYNENRNQKDYQRLEFLGDALLSKIVSEKLFLKTNLSEAEMTKIKISMVKSETLAELSRIIGIENLIFLGNGFSSKSITDNILDDVFEALCAAIYIDQGSDKLLDFLNKTLFLYHNKIISNFEMDYKSLVQEKIQSITRKSIIYRPIIEDSKNKKFSYELISDNKVFSIGNGESKKEAIYNAAKNAYENLAKNTL
jgi:ribonuclease III